MHSKMKNNTTPHPTSPHPTQLKQRLLYHFSVCSVLITPAVCAYFIFHRSFFWMMPCQCLLSSPFVSSSLPPLSFFTSNLLHFPSIFMTFCSIPLLSIPFHSILIPSPLFTSHTLTSNPATHSNCDASHHGCAVNPSIYSSHGSC